MQERENTVLTECKSSGSSKPSLQSGKFSHRILACGNLVEGSKHLASKSWMVTGNTICFVLALFNLKGIILTTLVRVVD